MKSKVTYLFSFLLFFAMVAGLGYSYHFFDKIFPAKFIFGFTLFLVGPLILYLRYLYLNKNRQDEFRSLSKEFEYLRRNSHTGILVGIGVTSFLVGIGALIYQPDEKNGNVFNEKVFEIVTLYITTITSFLVIKTIFEKAAPISDVETLLNRFCEDVEELLKKGNAEVWISFPALTIGYYRESANKVSKSNYKDYINKLNLLIEDESIKVTVITYKPELYQKLFEEYVKLNSANATSVTTEETNIAKACEEESTMRYNNFANATSKNCVCKGVEPFDLDEHFMIVDDIVYTITTFDLPVYQKGVDGNYSFQAPGYANELSKDKLAKLYAYRQQDKELAELIKMKVGKQLNINQSK